MIPARSRPRCSLRLLRELHVPISAARSPMRRRCELRGLARRMSTAIGKRPITFSLTATRCIRLKRISGDPEHVADCSEASRALLHGALAVYLIRYLNVPPARLPARGDAELASMPSAIDGIRSALLDVFDRQHQIDAAANLVMRHLTLGYPPDLIISALARALLREDAGLHAFQMFDAGVRQFAEWGNTEPGQHILVAVARYLAAHSPTERGWLQTADIAARLSRGEQVHTDQLPRRP